MGCGVNKPQYLMSGIYLAWMLVQLDTMLYSHLEMFTFYTKCQ